MCSSIILRSMFCGVNNIVLPPMSTVLLGNAQTEWMLLTLYATTQMLTAAGDNGAAPPPI